jgi:hypothetical protein
LNIFFTDGTDRNGKSYEGTTRTAFLPDTQQGRQILGLLKESLIEN